ncbi:hypothetical protein M0805_000458 [Coniferiporia weirii]|nr:hypothetical protein M0805_000458 [Coniferiporia weirii]
MRTSGRVPRSEEEGREQRHHHGDPGRASPSPSLTDSYGDDDDDDDELEEDDDFTRGTDQGSHAGYSTSGPVPAATGTGTSAATAPTQKPKRTRQLTTQHQLDVLHALLAKSRFPTTAVREEVGRQIGLSARKVQVWFQNQRQKARKGSKDASVSDTHSTQQRPGPWQPRPYTPSFMPPTHTNPSFVEGSSSTVQRPIFDRSSDPGMGIPFPDPTRGLVLPPLLPPVGRTGWPAPRRGSAPEPQHDTFFSSSTTAPFSRPYETGVLTGPGVPGASVGSPPYPLSMSPEHPLRLPPVAPNLPREGHTSAASYDPEHPAYEPPAHLVHLPPLQLDREPHRPFDMQAGGSQGSLVSRPPSGASRSAHPRPSAMPFPRPTHLPSIAHSLPGMSPTSMSSHAIPPPFTLEPRPVWSETPPGPSTRPHSSLGARQGPSLHTFSMAGSSSRAETRRASEGERSLRLHEIRTPPAPVRTTRFDPVRNTETTITTERQSRTLRSHSPDDKDYE